MIVHSILSVLLILLSPVIVISNVLILSAWLRFKRLRTPSNILIVSLSSADLGIGLLIPSSVAIDLTITSDDRTYMDVNIDRSNLSTLAEEPGTCPNSFYCFHFIVLLIFCSAALLSISSIALDRFLSVSQPLRYNHFVTMSHAQKFIIGAWIYSLLVGSLPLGLHGFFNPEIQVVSAAVLVYLPCLASALTSYGYIYVIARSHARAIYSVEISLNHAEILEVSDLSHTTTVHHAAHHRYGLTLALLLLAFFCWIPVQVLAAVDVFGGARILSNHQWRLLAIMPVVLTSVVNPWLYAYRSSEVRQAVIRIIDVAVCRLTGRPPTYPLFYGNGAAKGAEMTSCGSNVRLLAISPTQTTLNCSHSHNSHSHSHTGSGVTVTTGNGTLGVGLMLPNGAPPSPSKSSLDPNQKSLHFLLCDYQVSTL